ncbi:DUF2190 family protein [Limobrevibacterium gyesilva]|uniref:DUF2190 family protein n=1 Tax=Limobrevibacterium gyesilva TaxID=2991712 RepID=A0AA41YNV5_9PROT|nr:DUF2190 family protein [Limobrevibacterium gyesilva]
MARNYINDGTIVETVAPSGGAVSGRVLVQGQLAGVALSNAASGANVAIRTLGTFTFPKASGASTSIAAGGNVYWDAAGNAVTNSATSNTRIGVALAAAANADTSVVTRFNGNF